MMMRHFWPAVGTLIDAQGATFLVAVITHEWPLVRICWNVRALDHLARLQNVALSPYNSER